MEVRCILAGGETGDERDQLMINAEDIIMLACSVGCIPDAREWMDGVEHEGIEIQKMFTLHLSLPLKNAKVFVFGCAFAVAMSLVACHAGPLSWHNILLSAELQLTSAAP